MRKAESDAEKLGGVLTILPEVLAIARKDENPALVYLARLAPGSRPTMKDALSILAELATEGKRTLETLRWGELRHQHTAALRAKLVEKYAPATANKILAALRGALTEAWRLGQMTAEDYYRAKDLPSVKGETLPKGRALTSGEIGKLFMELREKGRPGDIQDAAILALAYGAGLRRAEIVNLNLSDYNRETGELRIRREQANRDRIVDASHGSGEVLKDWLTIRGLEEGPLFCPVTPGGKVRIRRMTGQAIWILLKRLAEKTGVAPFSPHDLRRTFILDLFDAGADTATVQKLVGHSNMQTTLRYDRRGEAAKRKASELLSIPWQPEITQVVS